MNRYENVDLRTVSTKDRNAYMYFVYNDMTLEEYTNFKTSAHNIEREYNNRMINSVGNLCPRGGADGCYGSSCANHNFEMLVKWASKHRKKAKINWG